MSSGLSSTSYSSLARQALPGRAAHDLSNSELLSESSIVSTFARNGERKEPVRSPVRYAEAKQKEEEIEENDDAEKADSNSPTSPPPSIDEDFTFAPRQQQKARSSSVGSQFTGMGGSGGVAPNGSPVHMTRGATRRLSRSESELATEKISSNDETRRKVGENRIGMAVAAAASGRSQQTIVAVGEKEKAPTADVSGSLQKATGGQKGRYSNDEPGSVAFEPSKIVRRSGAAAHSQEEMLWQKQSMKAQSGWGSTGDRASAFLPIGAREGGGRSDLGSEMLEKMNVSAATGHSLMRALQEIGTKEGEGANSRARSGLFSDPFAKHQSTSPHGKPESGLLSQNARFRAATDKSEAKATGDDPALECEVCHRRFAAASGLGKHRLTHTEEKRYSCTICNRGFKRQDHLTNHMQTHRERKPFKCQVGDCQKSYCDLRSLKRHTESHHGRAALEEMLKSRTSSLRTSVSVTATNDDTDDKNVHGNGSEVDHVTQENVSAVAALPTTSSSPQHSKQGLPPPPPSVPPPPPLTKITPRVDPTSSSIPSALNPIPTPFSGYKPPSQQNGNGASSGGGVESGVSVTAPGFAPQLPFSFTSNSAAAAAAAAAVTGHVPMFPSNWHQYFLAAYNPQLNFPYIPYGIFSPNMPSLPPTTATGAVGSNGAPSAAGPPQTSASTSSASSVVQTAYSTPTASPVKVKKERGPVSPAAKGWDTSKQAGKNGSRPTGSHGQVQCPICMRYFKNVKSLNGHLRLHGGYEGANKAAAAAAAQSRSGSNPTQQTRRDKEKSSTRSSPLTGSSSASARAPETAFQTLLQAIEATKRKEEENDASLLPPAAKRRKTNVHFRPEPEILNQNSPGLGSSEIEDLNFESPSPPDMTSSSSSSPGRRRRRPGNLNLQPTFHPDDDTVYYAQPTTHPPYTPPPMLSPRAAVSASASPLKSPRMTLLNTSLPNTPKIAMTPGSAKYNSPWMPRRISLGTGEGGVEEQITLTPRINVGSQFQAEVPSFASEETKVSAVRAKHKATRVWSPSDEQDQEELVDAYLDLACSNLIRYCGQNKEYALHVLHQNKGDVQVSVRVLLSGNSLLKEGDPLTDYHYSGSTRWTRLERQKFRQAWRIYGKQFLMINNALDGSKTMRDIIEYYYRWKKYCNTEYRGRTRHESDDFDTDEEVLYSGPPFECEYPDCGATFASRQSLNGHIRVHGGNFVYKMETRRSRTRNRPYSVSPAAEDASASGAMDDESPFPPNAEPNTRDAHVRINIGPPSDNGSLQSLASLMPVPAPPFFGHQSVLAPPPLHPGPREQVPFSSDSSKTFIPPHYTSIAPAPVPAPSRGGTGRGRRGGAGAARGANATSIVPAVTNGSSTNLEGKLEFKCKVCGRVFSKVKSRSAHMKIHSTRSEDF